MRFHVAQISSEEWKRNLCEDAFIVTFGDTRSNSMERIDYALISYDDRNAFSGFLTCKEMDAKTLYWQYGGIMPNYIGTIQSFRIYMSALEWACERYKRVVTRIENVNVKMLKMAMKAGFLINGSLIFDGKVYLELTKEF